MNWFQDYLENNSGNSNSKKKYKQVKRKGVWIRNGRFFGYAIDRSLKNALWKKTVRQISTGTGFGELEETLKDLSGDDLEQATKMRCGFPRSSWHC